MIQELVSKVADKSEPITNEGQGIQKFGRFVTGYMSTASLVTAALPIPVRSLHLIPAFASQEKFMNSYTSMSCFLVFAYVFYSRHTLARWMFARRGAHFAVRFGYLCYRFSFYAVRSDARLHITMNWAMRWMLSLRPVHDCHRRCCSLRSMTERSRALGD